MTDYVNFLKNKMAISTQTGFDVDEGDLTPTLYPHVKDTVRWAVRGGCRAIFSSFGMQKTVTQLEILRQIVRVKGGCGLVVCPKRVVVEFLTQAKQHLGIEISYVRTMDEVRNCTSQIRFSSDKPMMALRKSMIRSLLDSVLKRRLMPKTVSGLM